MKLSNLGQLITKYPQLKKCSVEMLECLDFTRIDDNFDFSPYILVDNCIGILEANINRQQVCKYD